MPKPKPKKAEYKFYELAQAIKNTILMSINLLHRKVVDKMIKAIPFQNKSDFLSDKLFKNHCKLYEGYVDKVNSIEKELLSHAERKDANATYSKYRGLKKGETYATNGVILHELYFQNIGKTCEEPLSETKKVFEKFFDSTSAYFEDLKACGKSARGWAILVYEQRTKSFKNILLDLHDYGVITMAYPILILDMYEHAYTTDYGIDKETYINNFIKDINWEVVENRIKSIEI